MSSKDQPDAGVKAIIGAEIIDGNGGAPIKDGVIVIDGKRISAVGDRSTPVPPHAKRITADGKFIIPGLICTGGHILEHYYVDTLLRYEGRYDDLILEAAQLTLRAGFTTTIDGGTPRDNEIKVRNAINEGREIGPRIRTSGGTVGDQGPYGEGVGRPGPRDALSPAMAETINSRWECNIGPQLWSMSPVQVREEVRKYIESGINWLNVMVGGNYGSEHFIRFSPRVLRAIVEEGHRAGLVLRANCMYSNETALLALDVGFDLVYIAMSYSWEISAELIDQLAKRQATMWFRPNTRQELETVGDVVKGSGHFARTNKNIMEAKPRSELAFLRAGVPMALSMGGGMYSAAIRQTAFKGFSEEHLVIGKEHINAIKGALELGMKPLEILKAGTLIPARAHKIDKDVGTLEKGKFADLLVLDRNPLERAENYSSISVLMKEGQIIDRDALPTQRLLSLEYPKHLLGLTG
jgi:imidazolonepropionase-like amidohydrolase